MRLIPGISVRVMEFHLAQLFVIRNQTASLNLHSIILVRFTVLVLLHSAHFITTLERMLNLKMFVEIVSCS